MTTLASDGTELAAPATYVAFPGRVVAPDGTERRQVRVIVTTDRLVAYGADGPTVRTVLVVDVASQRPDGTRWVVVDVDGREWAVGPDGGCGCGSPLRAMATPPPVYVGGVDPDDVRY